MKEKDEYKRGYSDGFDGFYNPPESGDDEIRDYDEGYKDGDEDGQRV